MFFVLMSNKILLLLNYYVQSSINYIINLTENIYTTSIVERLCVWGGSGVQTWAGQILTVQCYKWFITTSTSTLIFLSTLPWRYDVEMSTANLLLASA